ncbi:MAG: hypothetical protein ACM3ME_04440 [Chloroflexota bacterium]|nr:hypothetical protein [Lentimicrobium sp.]
MERTSMHNVRQFVSLRFIMMLILAVSLGSGLSSCQSQKKLAKKRAAQELAEKTAQAKKDLQAIINDNGQMTLEEKEFKLNSIKRMNLEDQEVKDLIVQAEEKLASERAAVERKKEEERLAKEREAKDRGKYSSIVDAFSAVAGARDVSAANIAIREALMQFSNEDVPVLILISQDGDIKDYDEPTTIKKYLEYIKDQKKSPNKVLSADYDSNGKIKLLELQKR